MSNTGKIYVGLMSGTSLDGVDVTIVDFSSSRPQLLFGHTYPWQGELQQQVTDLCTPGNNEIQRLGELDVRLGQHFAACVNQALRDGKIDPRTVRAIGSHGQTVRHQPIGATRFTLQVGDPNTLAYLTGITTVADFRRADMAAGGQGAPLVPAFHRQVLHDPHTNRVALNIGGIANITLLPADPQQPVVGFDTGPGNGLLNSWIKLHQQKNYDADGRWAASGMVQPQLLQRFLADNYFHAPAPKSTGREHFNLAWIQQQLRACDTEFAPQDVQATLAQLTAQSIELHIRQAMPDCDEILVCGGGWHNRDLIRRLQQLTPARVVSTASAGIDPDFMEGMCFAWLAKQRMELQTGSLREVTGATRASILGGVYAPPPT